MKVVHMCSVHTALDVRIFWRHCRSLAEAGYEVVYLVAHPRSEERDGVRLRAVKPPSGRLDRMWRVRREIYQAALEENADLYHIHSPEMLPYAVRLKRLGYPTVYDAHEDLPAQNAIREWIPGPLRGVVGRYVEAVELRGARAMDAVCVAHSTILHRFPEDRTIVLNNYPRLEMFPDPSEWPRYVDRPPQFCFVSGECTRARGLEALVEALALLPKELEAGVTLVGRVPADLEAELSQHPGWARVDSRGSMPFHEMAKVTVGCRGALLPFLPVAHHRTSFPNKLFEYMAAGLPILATDMEHWRRHLEGVDCVRWIDPLRPETLAEAMTDILSRPDEAEEMGARGRRAVEERLNWAVESRKLIALYERILAKKARPVSPQEEM